MCGKNLGISDKISSRHEISLKTDGKPEISKSKLKPKVVKLYKKIDDNSSIKSNRERVMF